MTIAPLRNRAACDGDRPELAVVDPEPAHRRLLATAGATAGFTVACPPDPVPWAARHEGVLLLAVLRADESDAVRRIREVNSRVTVVALTEPAQADTALAVLRQGATVVLDRRTDPRVVVLAAQLARSGHALMPAPLLPDLLGSRPPGTVPHPGIDLDDADRELLQDLAAGATVRRMARHRFQAPRTVERHLRRLYSRIGADDRVQAVAKATQMGLIRVSG
ncbi:LuxR C-terminal-related transcriptional regulator [Kitasatospora misakiensis]|uniref:LuxR C-terminal-related transcriptional regulator n=1 Tax=Kitasatospora misakiensis TaxID=67330 RepID=A0ABW0XDD6_9ACTN